MKRDIHKDHGALIKEWERKIEDICIEMSQIQTPEHLMVGDDSFPLINGYKESFGILENNYNTGEFMTSGLAGKAIMEIGELVESVDLSVIPTLLILPRYPDETDQGYADRCETARQLIDADILTSSTKPVKVKITKSEYGSSGPCEPDNKEPEEPPFRIANFAIDKKDLEPIFHIPQPKEAE